jgi:mono/diheme cytochrome c family protein
MPKKRIMTLFLAMFLNALLLGAAQAESPNERGRSASPIPSTALSDKRQNATLYNANCAICHGQAKRGQSPFLVRNAIRKNTGGMGSLSFLTPEQLNGITDF